MTNLDEKKPRPGVYISKTGKLKVFEYGTNEFENPVWIVDSGRFVPTPFRGIKVNLVQEMTPGFPVFDSFGALYKCEYLGEL